ncbi:unnamed protein product [Blepharisma stoltei]|uniref:C2H2-type domain-containing protein n=1 Tax=Blepharisma stoltei TaxID=1481888 RepID=A0AAU9IMV1_9CILI|nr:unnamed protein product [Blepharisma stoltei]
MTTSYYDPGDVIEYCLLTNWYKPRPDHLQFDSKNLKDCMIYLKTSKFRKYLPFLINDLYIKDPTILSQLSISRNLFNLLNEPSNRPLDDEDTICFLCGNKEYAKLIIHLRIYHKLSKEMVKDYFAMYENEYKAIGSKIDYYEDKSTVICDLCKKPYCSLYYRKHIFVHFNLRFIPCPICGKLRSKQNLKGHIYRAHERPGGLLRDDK